MKGCFSATGKIVLLIVLVSCVLAALTSPRTQAPTPTPTSSAAKAPQAPPAQLAALPDAIESTPSSIPTGTPTPTGFREVTMYVCADGDGVNVRSKMDLTARTDLGYPDGKALTIVDHPTSEWGTIRTGESTQGYIPWKYLCATPPTPSPTPKVPTATKTPIVGAYVSYDSLARNTEDWVGKYVHLTGKVVQVIEGAWGDMDLRMNIVKGDYGIWTGTIYVHCHNCKRVLEDDILTFNALVEGRMTYRTVLGASVTVPEVTVVW